MERRILKKTTYTEQLSHFRELYDLGLNDKEIAERLGIPATFVNLERTSLGLPPMVSKRASHVEQRAQLEAAEQERRVIPPLAKLRGSNLAPFDMARDILAHEGRSRSVKQGTFTIRLLDGRNATPFQWLAEANKVLAREGLPPIGRGGGWN